MNMIHLKWKLFFLNFSRCGLRSSALMAFVLLMCLAFGLGTVPLTRTAEKRDQQQQNWRRKRRRRRRQWRWRMTNWEVFDWPYCHICHDGCGVFFVAMIHWRFYGGDLLAMPTKKWWEKISSHDLSRGPWIDTGRPLRSWVSQREYGHETWLNKYIYIYICIC